MDWQQENQQTLLFSMLNQIYDKYKILFTRDLWGIMPLWHNCDSQLLVSPLLILSQLGGHQLCQLDIKAQATE